MVRCYVFLQRNPYYGKRLFEIVGYDQVMCFL